VTEAPTAPPPQGGARYINRELSWLRFNERVLEEALDPSNPLIERMRFLTIFCTNLDEFFMVRVSALKQQERSGVEVVSFDGLSPRAQLSKVQEALHTVLPRVYRCFDEEVRPALRAADVHVVHYPELDAQTKAFADDFYLRRVHPVLTPLAVGPTKTFPFISNLSLNIAVDVQSPTTGERRLARVKIPAMLPRLVRVGGGSGSALAPPVRLLPIEELVIANLPALFPGMILGEPWLFRVTRDADLEIKEDEADDLLTAIREEVRNRRFGRVVRLEVQRGMPPGLREALRKGVDVDESDVYEAPDPLDLSSLKQLLALDLPDAKFPPYVPRPRPMDDLFGQIRRGDILLHHPFEAFTPVVEFLQQAARDPNVRAIKQTLYRTSGDSPIVKALLEAVLNGKQVAAVVELKARFDEENNITWAQMLEEAGVHVNYGEVHRKVHAKLALVVRQEGGDLVRYAHLGTGNYNPTTARVYTDLGILTADPRITADVADLFNRLTGFSEPAGYRELLVAYRFMHAQLINRIAREAAHARAGRPARIIVKCNAIAEQRVIDALYEASSAGVRIDLIVRGICCLRPGIRGLSENISVRSVLGRFLEHSRVVYFENGGQPEVYIGSADLMERNLKNRIEVLTPVRDPSHARWLFDEFLARYLQDTERTRVMDSDGLYRRLKTGSGYDVHASFLEPG
jgi:polyphosphate kinase